MEQSGEYRIGAGRDEVWQGLNDPEILKKCIDGCQAMTKVSDERFDTTVKAKIGPVNATFNAELNLENLNPPESYSIQVSAKGGAAGFGKGTADVQLAEDGEQTLLTYQVHANVGGKLAQVGSRLIDGVARKMADNFFSEFARELSGEEGAVEAAMTSAPTSESSGQWLIWLVVFAALVIALALTL